MVQFSTRSIPLPHTHTVVHLFGFLLTSPCRRRRDASETGRRLDTWRARVWDRWKFAALNRGAYRCKQRRRNTCKFCRPIKFFISMTGSWRVKDILTYFTIYALRRRSNLFDPNREVRFFARARVSYRAFLFACKTEKVSKHLQRFAVVKRWAFRCKLLRRDKFSG